MDIDYDAALAARLEWRAKILAELEAKRAAVSSQPAQLIRFQPPAPRPAAEAVGRPVLMAVAAKGGRVASHFGHAKEFLVYQASSTGASLVGQRQADAYCSGAENCDDDAALLDRTLAALAGCEVVLCSRIGYEPWGRLAAAGISPNGEHAMEPIEQAVMAVWHEMLAAGKLAAGPAAVKRA